MVEFILRGGDIDARYLGANRALEGTRVHQRVQKLKKKAAKDAGEVYKSEVPLAVSYARGGIVFNLDGRADGIQTGGGVTIDEIKSTLKPVSLIEADASHWHWAQAKCYGFMYLYGLRNAPDVFISDDEKPDGLTVTLTYCHTDSGEIRVFSEYFTFDGLKAFFDGLLDKYLAFARMDITRVNERNETAKALAFPYGAYRPGQRELAVAVYTTVKQRKKIFAQAPTGIGKTISALFPAVKSLAEGNGAKIFYLTAKTIARQVAEDAFRQMLAKGLKMRVVTLTARDKICFMETRKCAPEYCPYAEGHFDRVNAALLDCINNELIINRQTIEQYARRHMVCPGEFQLDAALFCDAVICDYNHAYAPNTKIQRFFQFGGDYILLNDEAHNLADRARDMFSAGLYKDDFAAPRKAIGKKHPLYKPLGAVIKALNEIFKTREPFCLNEHPPALPPVLTQFAASCDEYLTRADNDPHMEALLNAYFIALDYLRVTELYDERYAFYCEPGYIRLYCLDPSFLLSLEQKKNRACVFFSATLTPLNYFRALLGGGAEDYIIRLASPFPRENLCLMVDDRISTRYKNRESSRERVADRLYEMVSGKTGNYFAFFPSYAYLEAVYAVFADKYPHVSTKTQERELNEDEREAFLADFVDQPSRTLLAFAVLGGVFSEGIDLTGGRLIGAAVVGVGLPLISAERNVIMDYYNRFDDTGFAFAYIYPGMNKVMQAAGRVIRAEADRGVVLLIDSRFTEAEYRSLFPREWDGFIRLRGGGHMADALREFWQ